MAQRWFFAGLVLCLLVGCQTTRQADYTWATLVLPDGHSGPGREVFVGMSCASCHEVAWDTEMPEPVSANPGPHLGRTLTHQTTGWVVSAIIAPSHHVPAEFASEVSGGLSPMGDYSDAMTVRELIDLVAYLRTQGDSMAQARFPSQQERFPHHL